jgi:hypothetical protein
VEYKRRWSVTKRTNVMNEQKEKKTSDGEMVKGKRYGPGLFALNRMAQRKRTSTVSQEVGPGSRVVWIQIAVFDPSQRRSLRIHEQEAATPCTGNALGHATARKSAPFLRK